jgi:hypothetical protein
VLAVEVQTWQDIFRGKASSDYMHAKLSLCFPCKTFHMLKNQCAGISFPLVMQKLKVLALKNKLNIRENLNIFGYEESTNEFFVLYLD